MSLIIKGMKLPENDGMKELVIGRAPNGTEPIAIVSGDIMEFYKVIELPAPHGRLIDADKLIKFIQDGINREHDSFGYDGIEILAEVQFSQTIIEAEENDEK